ncbi:MAG: 30S ribosomal protein S27ae [Thermoplasmata archaeon]
MAKGKGKDAGKGDKLQIHQYYEVTDSGVVRKKPSCPKCGPGTFMATHKDRVHCGRCGYTEFK